MSLDDLSILHLHDHPELLQQCCDLLNDQWKRSTTARLHSLSGGGGPSPPGSPPGSLLLVRGRRPSGAGQGQKEEVVGHSRLASFAEDPRGCWISSVVIDKKLRGKGLGKYLMLKTEEYAKALGYFTAYLCTQDQQGFYERLNYVYCKNNLFISSQCLMENIVAAGKKPEPDSHCCKSKSAKSYQEGSFPPPPPPLPPLTYTTKNDLGNRVFTSALGQVWMKKALS